MPRVKALSAEGNVKRDRLAKDLIAQGKPQSNAYAIATAAMERNEGVRPKKKAKQRKK